MVYLNEVINFLNQTIKTRIGAYPTAKIEGVMTQTIRNEQAKTVIYPTIINLFGKAEYTGFDNRVPFTAYHRLVGSTFTRNVTRDYADGDLVMINSVTDVQLIVWGMREKLNIKPEQLALVIADLLPYKVEAPEFPKLGILDLRVIETGISYDQRAIFQQEIQGIPYFIGPEMFVFSVRYRIEGSYMKGCLNKCEC